MKEYLTTVGGIIVAAALVGLGFATLNNLGDRRKRLVYGVPFVALVFVIGWWMKQQ